ncbi:uncharacterized protein TNCV_196371 [Trichonephila clavipes]|uniref:Uncharacterized protein n=1 Tax=Trichonephila clavipes TaxID=2585209 RepID=A0A8X6WJP9_TRICX|nr:uncharacterized protein TNCV_196371 [Trichonephila clavipes]
MYGKRLQASLRMQKAVNVINCSSVDWKTLPRCFGSTPTDRTCAQYSAVVDDKLATLTSLVKMWMPQQKMCCVLWLKEFLSVMRAQRQVRTEWNADASDRRHC